MCQVKVLSKFLVKVPILHDEYLTNIDVNHEEWLKIVSQPLKELANNCDHYFREHEGAHRGNLWINDAFIEDISKCNLDPKEKEKLIELCCNSLLCSQDIKKLLSQFWVSLENKYLSLSLKAMLVVFSTRYLCEKTFSSLTLIKTKKSFLCCLLKQRYACQKLH